MDALASKITEIVKDFRNDDGIQMTPERVLTWVEQFEPNDQYFILEELAGILDKTYLSKMSVVEFLQDAIKFLTKSRNYDSPITLLENTVFLDLQEHGKSQKVLLSLVDELLQKEYDVDLSFCGSKSSTDYIYLDDALCTGNTAYYDISEWLNEEEKGTSRLAKILEAKTKVVLLYVFIHAWNVRKLRGRFYYSHRPFKFDIVRAIEVENDFEKPNSKLDFVFPIYEGQPQRVIDYFESLQTSTKTGIFRRRGSPSKETFFSSPENRIRFENILLHKGLEILDSVTIRKENIRPLGYTLPSHKNLGFGTLCFTWRNVPNNTPLVFWYESSTWFPLFEKRQEIFEDIEGFFLDFNDII